MQDSISQVIDRIGINTMLQDELQSLWQLGGYVNTGGDLIANGIGALIAVLLISVTAGKAQ